MAEVAKGIYARLIESGIPVAYISPSYEPNITDKVEGQKFKIVDFDIEGVDVVFDNFPDNVRETINIPVTISEVRMDIGKRKSTSIKFDLKEKTYNFDPPSDPMPKRYVGKFNRVMKEFGFKRVF
jgi:hypothetical protein